MVGIRTRMREGKYVLVPPSTNRTCDLRIMNLRSGTALHYINRSRRTTVASVRH